MYKYLYSHTEIFQKMVSVKRYSVLDGYISFGRKKSTDNHSDKSHTFGLLYNYLPPALNSVSLITCLHFPKSLCVQQMPKCMKIIMIIKYKKSVAAVCQIYSQTSIS